MNSATEPTREECIEWLKKVLDPRFVGHRQYAAILNLLRPAEREGGLREADNFNDEFFQLRKALCNWPKLPPAYVLKWLDGKFSEDWPRGKAMQRELGLSVIPPKTECEEGAGMWDRITEGKWRAALAPAQAPSAKGVGHEQRVVQHVTGQLEYLPQCVCGDSWPCSTLSTPSFTEEERETLERAARALENRARGREIEFGPGNSATETFLADASTLRNLATKGRL